MLAEFQLAFVAARADDVTFSPDSSRVATGNQDGSAVIWDTGSGAVQVTLIGHDRYVYGVDYNHDGKQLVFASNRFGKVKGETNVFIADWH